MATWILAIAAAATLVGTVVTFIYTTVRDGQIMRGFVKSLATNHLPHIQESLRVIAEKIQVDLPEPPPIDFIDLTK